VRKLFSAIAIGALGLALAAAPADAQSLKIGVEGGLNLADVSLENGADDALESATGYRVGGIVRLGLPGGIFHLQSGVSLSQEGADPAEDATDAAGIELDYVEVPLLVGLSIPTGPAPITPRIYAGPALAFESDCTLTAENGISVDAACDDPTLGELTLDTESTDYRLLFGGGVDIPAGPGALTVDLRYDLGLRDINATEGTDVVEIKNRNFQAVAGYAISIL